MKTVFKEISVINTLRGIAALVVCLYHFVCTTTDYIENQIILDIFSFGKKGVQIFFIISGIVIPLSMLKAKYSYKLFSKFISKRFIRIEPPYIAAVALGIIYAVVRNYIPSSNQIDLIPNFKTVILHLGYLIPFFENTNWISPVFWTLSIEFQYYLILALLIPMIISDKKVLKWIFTIIILALSLFSNQQAFFLYWSAYFGLGIFYILYKYEKYSLYEFIVIMILCSTIVFFNQGLIDLTIGIGTLLVINYFPSFKSKIGNFLGKISYSLYLIHAIIGSAIINYLSHIYKTPLSKLVVILIGLAISIISAYIFWLIIEKPSQKIAQKIKLK